MTADETTPAAENPTSGTSRAEQISARDKLREQVAHWLHEQYGEHTQPRSVRVDSLMAEVVDPLLDRIARVEALADELAVLPGLREREFVTESIRRALDPER